MSSLLPPHAGLLPYWQLTICAFSLFNTTQCYRSKANALLTYAGPNAAAQVTDFGARMFGTWTALSCIVRLYAAYNIEDKSVYVLAFSTYAIAMAHFMMEWLAFGTMTFGVGLVRVAVVPIISISWMMMQWGFYVEY